jgi:His-Xaa-Ser system radical SAM maturase HxsC
MSFDLCVNDLCNNKCLMCTNPDRPWPAWDGSFDYSYKALIKRLKGKTDEIGKKNAIYLTGGEPTIHPHFVDLLHFLNRTFPKQTIKLLTNGRRFTYASFAKTVLNICPRLEVDLSLYGPNQKIHDAVTRSPGSFEQTTTGLRNLLDHKKSQQTIGLRLVLTKLSYKYLAETLELVHKKFLEVDRVAVIFIEMEAQAEKNLDSVGITYNQLKKYLKSVYPLIDGLKEFRLYHFPLCAVDKKLWPFVWRTLPPNEVAFVKICSRCLYKEVCLGIHKQYLKNVGSKEFKPIEETIKLKFSGDYYRPIEKVFSSK